MGARVTRWRFGEWTDLRDVTDAVPSEPGRRSGIRGGRLHSKRRHRRVSKTRERLKQTGRHRGFSKTKA